MTEANRNISYQEEAIRVLMAHLSSYTGSEVIIKDTLNDLGLHYDADSAAIYEKSTDGNLLLSTYTWMHPERETSIPPKKTLPIELIRIWENKYRNEGAFVLDKSEEWNNENPYLPIIAPLFFDGGIVSLLCIENPHINSEHLTLATVVGNALYGRILHMRSMAQEARLKHELMAERESILQLYTYLESMTRDIEDFFVVDLLLENSTPIKVRGILQKNEERRTHDYKLTWDAYINKHVFPEDRDMLRQKTNLEYVKQSLCTSNKHTIRFRIIDEGNIKNLQVIYARLMGDNPNLIGFGFRCIDDIIRSEQEQKAKLNQAYSIVEKSLQEIALLNKQLTENLQIISDAGYGIWRIYTNEAGSKAMVASEAFQKILGIEDYNLSPEDLYVFFHERLADDRNDIEQVEYKTMHSGKIVSNTHAWRHPTKGIIHLMTGGSVHKLSDGKAIISGYCTDVTEQIRSKERAYLTINSLAHSFIFINYITLEEGSFLSTEYDSHISDNFRNILKAGRLDNAINYFLQNIVAEEFRQVMSDFTETSTLNRRMAHTHLIINQYKDKRGIWYEWQYLVADRFSDGRINHLIWTVRQIEDEKMAEFRKQQIINDNIAANKAKTRFLQNMSHEIRTPLNAMFGFSQLLGLPDGTWSIEEKEQFNTYIRNSYNMVDMLVGDIMDIADSEHGNYRVNIAKVSVNSICRNSLMSVEYRKTAAVNLYFTTEVPDDYLIMTDGRRVQQVLINYLTNACKHTSKGEIHLHCSLTEYPGKLCFSVADTGTGVPADKAELIFKRFIKLNQFDQGSGLGLNICQLIADKLGGQVFLDKNYSNGARFVFLLELHPKQESQNENQ